MTNETHTKRLLSRVTVKSGRAAVFIRSMVETVKAYGSKPLPLRTAQAKALETVQSQGSDLSISYLSNLSRTLTDASVLRKSRDGKKFYLERGPLFHHMTDFLDEHPDWGTVADEGVVDVGDRATVLDHLIDHGSIRVTSEARLPKAAWTLVWDKFNAGELDLVFIEPDAVATSVNPRRDPTPVVIEPVTFANASVAR